MNKSIKLKNNTYLDSRSIVHNKKLLNKILDKPSDIKVLFINEKGMSTPSTGGAIGVAEPVLNFTYLLVITNKGVGINAPELDKTTSCGPAGNIWWFNNGNTRNCIQHYFLCNNRSYEKISIITNIKIYE